MPIYEYRCPKGHTFEVFHRIEDPPPNACEVCGGAPLEKVLHPVPIIFRGKGFYTTDYGSGRRKAADADTAKSADRSAKKPEKAEAKKAEPA